MLSKQTLSSKIVIFGLAVLLVFLGNLKYNQWKNQKNIEIEKNNLQAQAEKLQKQNDDLNQSLQYLSSPDFKEKVARQQLNLKKDGEMVFGFKEAKIQTDTAEKKTGVSNFKKWADYFFNN